MSRADARPERGQLVLLAAATVAAALVPLLFAYLQLGYHPDIAGTQPNHANDVERTLERSLVDAADGIPAAYTWGDRGDGVTAVRERLASTLDAVNRSALGRGTAIQVALNATEASEWIGGRCPSGAGRAFGPCEADRGVVVQERAGETHVVAAAFDVHVVAPDAETRLRTVVERR